VQVRFSSGLVHIDQPMFRLKLNNHGRKAPWYPRTMKKDY